MDEGLRTQARHARQAVRAGLLRGAALLEALLAVPSRERDGWVDELLGLPELPDDVPGLPLDTVPYLPCGVDTIVRAVLEGPVRAGDVFVDLGAGLGRPAMLVHLLSGARAVGVELQPHLVRHAQTTASELGLDTVSFVAGDAASLEVAAGTVFFIYSSFNDTVLAQVLSWLERMAARRRIVLCAVDFEVHDQPWLSARMSSRAELVFYDSKAPAGPGA
jgi:D-arabinose 1-dehydrogenase-like Zn-dependent alcohol dehydrogenase